MEQHQAWYEGTQGGAVHPALTPRQQEGNWLPITSAVQEALSAAPIDAGMWTQLVKKRKETGAEKKLRTKAESAAEKALLVSGAEIVVSATLKEVVDAKVKEHGTPLLGRGVNKDGFFARVRGKNV